jgi:hypothetical protein
LTLRPLAGRTAEMAALQAVLEAAPAYFDAIGSGPAEPRQVPVAVLGKPLQRTLRA